MKTYGPHKLTMGQMYSDRQVAGNAGHLHYFLGVPCKHGHIAPRFVSSSMCVDCGRMHYAKRTAPRREIAEKKRAERERIRNLKKQEKAIKRYGARKLLIEEMKVTRRQALEAGDSHYFTNKRCRNGHLSPRTAGNATCVICTRVYTNNWKIALKKQ